MKATMSHIVWVDVFMKKKMETVLSSVLFLTEYSSNMLFNFQELSLCLKLKYDTKKKIILAH